MTSATAGEGPAVKMAGHAAEGLDVREAGRQMGALYGVDAVSS